MTDTDKNQHLSPILSDIQDYGPARDDEDAERAPAVEEKEAVAGGDPDDAFQMPPQRGSGGRKSTVILSMLLILLLAASAGVAYQLQTRINQLEQRIALLQSDRQAPPGLGDEHSHPGDPELASLILRVENLQSQLVQLREERTSSGTAELHEPAGASTGTTEKALAPAAGGQTRPEPDAVLPSMQWYINLASFELESVARHWAASLENSPRPAQIVPVNSNGRALYRVRVGGFATRSDAQEWAKKLQALWQLDSTWVQLQDVTLD